MTITITKDNGKVVEKHILDATAAAIVLGSIGTQVDVGKMDLSEDDLDTAVEVADDFVDDLLTALEQKIAGTFELKGENEMKMMMVQDNGRVVGTYPIDQATAAFVLEQLGGDADHSLVINERAEQKAYDFTEDLLHALEQKIAGTFSETFSETTK